MRETRLLSGEYFPANSNAGFFRFIYSESETAMKIRFESTKEGREGGGGFRKHAIRCCKATVRRTAGSRYLRFVSEHSCTGNRLETGR